MARATGMGDRMSGRKQPQLSQRDNTEKTDAEKLIRGYPFGTVASALQKEVRRGDLEGAVYWGLILYEAAPQYAWKRVLVTAAEDIGFGDPEVVAKVCSMAAAWKVAKEGSWYVSPQLFTMAVVLLCRAQKSTWVEDLQTSILWPMRTDKENTTGWRRPVLPEHEDAHTAAGKARGATWAEWYGDRHIRFGIPVNEYTKRLWELYPEWRPTLKPGDVLRDETGAVTERGPEEER